MCFRLAGIVKPAVQLRFRFVEQWLKWIFDRHRQRVFAAEYTALIAESAAMSYRSRSNSSRV